MKRNEKEVNKLKQVEKYLQYLLMHFLLRGVGGGVHTKTYLNDRNVTKQIKILLPYLVGGKFKYLQNFLRLWMTVGSV